MDERMTKKIPAAVGADRALPSHALGWKRGRKWEERGGGGGGLGFPLDLLVGATQVQISKNGILFVSDACKIHI
jgi:hypothetical protein